MNTRPVYERTYSLKFFILTEGLTIFKYNTRLFAFDKCNVLLLWMSTECRNTSQYNNCTMLVKDISLYLTLFE